jgi:lipopolysaccharide export system permease protein
MKMARDDNWTVWFGKLLGTAVLAPIAVFFTYKANNDSTVFNFDLYKHFFCRLFGIRQKRHIFKKEVIINDPEYLNDKMALLDINDKVVAYSKAHNLLKAPNPIKVFFHQGDDRSIRDISNRLEKVIEDLGNSKDKIILHELNTIPFVATHAHTRPFKNKWANLATGIIIPLGLFFYLRMVRYRLRLMKDLKLIRRACENIAERIDNRPELYS